MRNIKWEYYYYILGILHPESIYSQWTHINPNVVFSLTFGLLSSDVCAHSWKIIHSSRTLWLYIVSSFQSFFTSSFSATELGHIDRWKKNLWMERHMYSYSRTSELPVVQESDLLQRVSLVWAKSGFAAHLLPPERAVTADNLKGRQSQSKKWLYNRCRENHKQVCLHLLLWCRGNSWSVKFFIWLRNTGCPSWFEKRMHSPYCWYRPSTRSFCPAECLRRWFPPRRCLCSCSHLHNLQTPETVTAAVTACQNQQIPKC